MAGKTVVIWSESFRLFVTRNGHSVSHPPSLLVPLNNSTPHMIGSPELAVMRSSAMLFNISRGQFVDETALHAALATGEISAVRQSVVDQ